MAGLMVIFSAGDDVADVIRKYGCGIVAPNTAPAELAAMIDRLSASEILVCKRRALESARALCWENEQLKLAQVYDTLAQEAVETRPP
jgi:hypothetical protein